MITKEREEPLKPEPTAALPVYSQTNPAWGQVTSTRGNSLQLRGVGTMQVSWIETCTVTQDPKLNSLTL